MRALATSRLARHCSLVLFVLAVASPLLLGCELASSPLPAQSEWDEARRDRSQR